MARRLRIRASLLAVLVCGAVTVALSAATPALAETRPWWRIATTLAPTNLPPEGEGVLLVSANNVGDSSVKPESKITIVDKLPEGLVTSKPSVAGKNPKVVASIAGSLLESGSSDFKPGKLFCGNGKPETVKKETVEKEVEAGASTVTCKYTGTKRLDPFIPLELAINVKAVSGASSGSGTVTLTEVPPSPEAEQSTSTPQPLTVSSDPTKFGVERYELATENEGGSIDTQAGSHPFQLTTTLDMRQTLAPNIWGFTDFEDPNQAVPFVPRGAQAVKSLVVKLPPGLVGNATSLARCSAADFNNIINFRNTCPANTAVGVASVTISEPELIQFAPLGGVGTATVPVFNLTPAPGEPARFGFDAFDNFVSLDTSVATGEDYAVVSSVNNITQLASALSSQVTLWGVPGDERHDISRGWGCLKGEPPTFPACEPEHNTSPNPFLSLPGSCNSPQLSTVLSDSWPEPGPVAPGGYPVKGDPRWSEAESQSAALTGCDQLPFNPSVTVDPGTEAGSTPTGLKVTVKLPQPETAEGLSEAAVKATTLVLPQGVLVNPASAHGLEACSEANVGFLGNKELEPVSEKEVMTSVFTPTLPNPFCPQASKVGTVRIKTPLLGHLDEQGKVVPQELTGGIYLAQQEANPFGTLLAGYIIAEDPVSGVLVKLAGKITLNQETGQITSVFENTPQTPFEELEVAFFSGSTATTTTPANCGTYTTNATFTPWSGTAPVEGTSSFPITSNCTQPPNAQPFAPSFAAGSTNTQAGAFTPFTLNIANPDGDQQLSSLTMHLPPGMAAMLSSVTPCPEPQAANNQCGPDSLIGHSTAEAGLGGDPFALPGSVYLTGPYKGAPFGISVVTPAVAGPFNLGDVTVRSTINVDRNNASVSVTSDPFPQFVQGIPSQIKRLNVTIDRPGFQFNPTNCNAMSITGSVNGVQGGSAPASTPFQVQNCAALPFKPTLTAVTKGDSTKANGASLVVKVSSSPGQANIAKTALIFPIALPSRLTTIQKACVDTVFEANPAACDEGSNIGTAIVHTPVLKNPLTGPAYLVSHGGAAFPDVEFVLQGEGITLVLDGQTNIKKGITSSTFNSVPDAPVTTFETVLPEGPHSALTANVAASKVFSLCGANLVMPTTITGQNGVVIKQETKIPVTGCKAVKSNKAKKLTRAQKLKKALKACKKLKKKNKRAACEKQARKKYGPLKAKKKSKKK